MDLISGLEVSADSDLSWICDLVRSKVKIHLEVYIHHFGTVTFSWRFLFLILGLVIVKASLSK